MEYEQRISGEMMQEMYGAISSSSTYSVMKLTGGDAIRPISSSYALRPFAPVVMFHRAAARRQG
jgi:hypothetical protein